MTIYRGTGGGGNATTDTEVALLTQLEQSAVAAAAAAEAAQAAALLAATEAAESASSIEGDVASAEAARIAAEAAQEAAEEAQDAAVTAQGLAEDARDAALAAEAALENVYTKDEADDLLDLKANQATTYTKTEVDSSLATKQTADAELTTLSGMGTNRATFLASEQAFSFRNRLINAQGLIKQRGYVSGTATTTANQYTLDRWRVVTSGQNLTFTTSNNEVTFTAPAGGVEQVIEGLNLESGTYVLNWEGTATATVGGAAVAKGGTVTVVGGTNTTVRFIGGTFIRPQFEAGTVATPFERRPYGTELALCQRYFAKPSMSVILNVGSHQRAHVFHKVDMRSSPTVTLSGATNTTVEGSFIEGFRLFISSGQESVTWTASIEL
jgi:hypothetical protein